MLHQACLTALLALGSTKPTAAAPQHAPSHHLAERATSSEGRLTPVTDRDFVAKAVAPHKGKIVVVSFWGSFCAPCLDEIPTLVRVLAEPALRDVALVFVSVDGRSGEADARAALRKRKLQIDSLLVVNDDPEPFILAVDPSWAGQVPYTVFFAPNGKRLFGVDGEQSEQELRDALAKARAMGSP